MLKMLSFTYASFSYARFEQNDNTQLLWVWYEFYMLKLIRICKVFWHALSKMTIASCFELFLQALLLAMWNSWNAMEQNATWIFRQQYGTYFGVHNLWHSPPWQYCPCKKSISQNFYVVYQKLQTNTKVYCAVSQKKDIMITVFN